MREEFSKAPTSKKEYELQGKKYIVTSHFCGKKDVNEVLHRIALNRALKEMGL